MATAYIQSVVGDAQTGITSLGGAVAGSAADRLGDALITMTGLGGQQSLGDIGLSFIVRTLGSAAVYGAAVGLMPETSENILFTILYFRANKHLVNDAVLIGDAVTGGLQAVTRTYPPARPSAPVYAPMPGLGKECRTCM